MVEESLKRNKNTRNSRKNHRYKGPPETMVWDLFSEVYLCFLFVPFLLSRSSGPMWKYF